MLSYAAELMAPSRSEESAATAEASAELVAATEEIRAVSELFSAVLSELSADASDWLKARIVEASAVLLSKEVCTAEES